MIKNYFLTTIRTLLQNPLYTALSVFGIALTFVFVSVVFLIAAGSKGDYIPPKYAERTWQIRLIHSETDAYMSIDKEKADTWVSRMTTPEMTVVTSNIIGELTIINGESVALNVLGVGDNYFDARRHKFLSGRAINKQEIADAAPVAVLDRTAANIYFGKSEDPIGKNFELNAIQYRVVGVVKNSFLLSTNRHGGLPPNVIVPLETVKSINRMIAFTAKDKASFADMQAELFRLLNETNTAEDTQWNITEKRSLEQLNEFVSGLGITIVCLILMLIPALNILSLNVSRSFERSEEIAIRKTFGAPVSTIFGQLLIENTIITLTGAVIGMCVTPMLMNVIDKMIFNISLIPMSFSMYFDWKTILIVAVPCVLLFSFLSGSVPAYITAKREIVNVLKGESL